MRQPRFHPIDIVCAFDRKAAVTAPTEQRYNSFVVVEEEWKCPCWTAGDDSARARPDNIPAHCCMNLRLLAKYWGKIKAAWPEKRQVL
jgi:hypothetical protein